MSQKDIPSWIKNIYNNYMMMKGVNMSNIIEMTNLGIIKLVGIKARTNNQKEMTPGEGIISPMIAKFHNMASKIANRSDASKFFCVYTEYDSDENGDYTYFVGAELSDFADIADGFTTLTIPAQNYKKFAVGPGAMPMVCINTWQDIWQNHKENRNYVADFEVYDGRSADPNNAELDIYIGMK